MSKRLAAVALVAFVALAGCSGGFAPTPGSGDDGTAPAPPALADQPWANADEQVNYTKLFAHHRNALANASSYTFVQRIQSGTSSGTNTRIAVNHAAERANLTVSAVRLGTEQRQETFVANGTVYGRSAAGNETQYGSADQNLTGAAFDRLAREQAAIRVGGGVFPALDFAYNGTENGTYVFEADSISTSEKTSFDAANVTDVSSRVAVAPEGYVSDLSLNLTVSTPNGERTVTALVRTENVNATTVSEPAWTDEAAAA